MTRQQLGGGGVESSVEFDLRDHATRRMVARLYQRFHAPRVRAAGLEVVDVEQEMLLRLHRRRDKWNPARGARSTWAYVQMWGIVTNLIDGHRRRGRLEGVLGIARDAALMADRHGETSEGEALDAIAHRLGAPPSALLAVGEGEDPFVAARHAGLGLFDALDFADRVARFSPR